MPWQFLQNMYAAPSLGTETIVDGHKDLKFLRQNKGALRLMTTGVGMLLLGQSHT